MSLALKEVWEMVKIARENNKAEEEEVNMSEWANYGYHRVYFEGAFHFQNTVRNGITNKLVEVTTSVHMKCFYDIEKGYIKFNKCASRYIDIAKNYIYDKLSRMEFKLEAKNNA